MLVATKMVAPQHSETLALYKYGRTSAYPPALLVKISEKAILADFFNLINNCKI
ncbi:MAG: hypothetical protein AAF757_16900 [Cyanobacteria bacterium P01_D01_bin.116]